MLLIAALVVAGWSARAYAVAGNYWDPSKTGSTSGGGTGTWDATDAFWYNGTTDVVWPGSGAAIFGGSSAGTVTLSSAQTAGGLTFNTAGYTIAGSALTLGSSPTITLNNAGTTTISAALSGSNGFSLAAGATTGGTLVLGGSLSGLSGGIAVGSNTTLQFNQASGTTLANNLSGAGTIATGSVGTLATLTLTGTNSSFSGTMQVGGGNEVLVATAAELPSASSLVVGVSGGALNSSAELDLAGAGVTFGSSSQNITFYGDGSKTLGLQGVLANSNVGGVTNYNVTLNSNTNFAGSQTEYIYASGNGDTMTLAGVFAGTAPLQKYGKANLILSNSGATANSYAGTLTIVNGIVTVNSGSLLGNNTGTVASQFPSVSFAAGSTDNAALTFQNAAETINNLSTPWGETSGTQTQTLTLTGTALTVDQTTNGSFVNGAVATLTSQITGTGSLILGSLSTATLTIGTANNYSGGTTINGGTLLVTNTSGSATGTNAVTVNSGGTLGGTGAISGTVNVAAGGIVAPSAGTSNFSTLTVGGLNLEASGAKLTFNLGASGTNDIIAASAGALTLTGGTLSFNNVAVPVGGGSYNLISYSTLTGSTSNLTLTPLAGYVESLAASGGEVTLNLNPTPTLTWSGASSTSWDTTTAGNWVSGGPFAASDNVVFDSSHATPGTVNVTTVGGVTAGTVTVSNTTGTYTFTGNSITGSSLTVNGGGTLILQNTNTYNSGVAVSSGTLKMGAGGTLASSPAFTLSTGGTFNLNAISQTIGALSGTGGSVLLGSTSGTILTVAQLGSVTYSGSISGTGSLIVAGTSGAIETLAGTNTYSGSTTINSGTLQLGAVGALPATPVILANTSGATFDLNGNNQTITELSGGGSAGGNVTLGVGTLTVGDASTTTFGGSITGAGNLVKVGAGNLILTGLSSTAYTGTTSIEAGTLTLGQASGTANLYAGASQSLAGTLVIANAIRANFNTGTFTGSGQIQVQTSGATITNVSGTGTATIDSTVSIVLNSTVSPTSAAGAFTTNIGGTTGGGVTINSNISGASNVSFGNGSTGGGAGNLILGGNNTWTGATYVNNSGGSGSVLLASANALPTGTALSFNTLSGGSAPKLDLGGYSPTVSSLSSSSIGSGTPSITNSSATTTSTLTIYSTAAPATNTFAGVISDGNAPVALTLATGNTGTLILTGANTYSGATTVSGGTLAVNKSLGGAGAVTVNSGGVLGGTGSIAGAVTVNSGGAITPSYGLATTSSLTLTGGLTLGSGSTLNFNLGAPGVSDLINASTSAVTINGGAFQFTNLNGNSVAAGTYDLINYNSIAGAGFGALTIGNSLSGFVLSLTNNTSLSEIQLTVANAATTNTWNGTVSGSWDTATANWQSPNSTFATGNAVVFDDTATGTTTITIPNGVTVQPSSMVFNNAMLSYTIGGPGSIGGTEALVKNDAGTLTLTGSNSYSGGTQINGGTLSITSDAALGATTGAVTFASGAFTLATTANMTSNRNFTVAGGSILDVAPSTTLTLNPTSGAIGGTGGVTKNDSGTLVLAGTSNTFTGGVTLNAGILGITSDLNLGASTGKVAFAGGTLQLQAAVSLGSSRTIATGASTVTATIDTDGNSSTVGGPVSGSGALTVIGGGSLTFTNASFSPGSLTATGAAVTLDSTSFPSAGVPVTLGSGGTLTLGSAAGSTVTLAGSAALNGAITTTNAITIDFAGLTTGATFSGSGALQIQATGTFLDANSSGTALLATLNNNVTLDSNSAAGPFVTYVGATNGNTLTIDGVLSGASNLQFKSGSGDGTGKGIVVLGAGNSYTGNSIVDNGGILQLAVNNALPTTTNLIFGVAGSTAVGAVDLDGSSQQVASLSSATTGTMGGITNTSTNATPATLVILGSSATTYSGPIGANSAYNNFNGTALTTNNNIALTLAAGNTGTLDLTGANTYSGATTINAGTLQFGQVLAMSANSAVTVASGGTLAVNAGGTGEFTNATSGAGSIGGLLSGVGGQSASVTFASGAALGIDTTNAGGSLTYAGNITNTTFPGLGLTKLGAGTLVLGGANTYTGTTTVADGTLSITGSVASHALAAGGYGESVSMVIDASSASNSTNPNLITFSGPTTTIAVANAAAYGTQSVSGSTVSGSSLGSQSSDTGVYNGTKADILLGTNSGSFTSGAAATVAMQWRTPTTSELSATSGGTPTSDILSLSGMNGIGGQQTDPFAIQISYNAATLPSSESKLASTGALFVGSVSSTTNLWQNSVIQNIGVGSQVNATNYGTALGTEDYQGSFADFEKQFGVTSGNLANYLGAWGVDKSTNSSGLGPFGTVWAIVNHNSQFAVVAVPEPSSLVLTGMGLAGLLAWGGKRRRARGRQR